MKSAPIVLTVDIGGSRVKVLTSDRAVPEMRRALSGAAMTPSQLMTHVSDLTNGWEFDVVSVGFPGPVRDNRVMREPIHLGTGWTSFDFQAAFGKPTRVMNDAAMQAVGSYQGGAMLFLGLGTGLGTTFIDDGKLTPMELGHLPYRNGRSYEAYLGQVGMDRMGKAKWRRHVENVSTILLAAFLADEVVLGGGNCKHLREVPAPLRIGRNDLAFSGGFRVWNDGTGP